VNAQAIAEREQAKPLELAPIPSSALTPQQMIYQLIAAGASTDAVRDMMALSKELAAEQARNAFDAAVADAKAEIKPVARNAKGHTKKYADFSAYAKEIDPVISKFGLSYRFRTEQTDRISVTCILSHRQGHSEENTLSGPADTSGSKNAIQAIGSTLTYLQRYTLIQALGLAAAADDDGATADTSEAPACLTKEQASELLALIDQSETDIEKFCVAMKIEAIPDMPAKNFEAAKNMLLTKIIRKQQGTAK
jgi:hypothetical protein